MNADLDARETEEFQRGYTEGIAWAREYATTEEVSAFVAADEGGRAFERGFLAGCEEVLLTG